jgi:hypothetical protein
MDETFSMDGFYTNPWGATDSGDLGLGGDISISDVIPDASLTNVAAESVGSTPFVSSAPSSSSWNIGDAFKVADFGLKVYDKILSYDNQVKDAQLNRFLKTAQMDIFHTQAQSAQEVARIKATGDQNLAAIYRNAMGTGAQIANVGQSNNSMMVYLTILGLVFAAIQIMNSAK